MMIAYLGLHLKFRKLGLYWIQIVEIRPEPYLTTQIWPELFVILILM